MKGGGELEPDAEGPDGELRQLREENARLRALLGMDERAPGGHMSAWSPSLLSTATVGSPVDERSSEEARLALFRSLFGARSDVFATRWENASTSRSGWSPATRGGPYRQRGARVEHLPLSDEILTAHLLGQQTVGIYPLLRGDTCALLVCDFDKGSWVLDALAYLDACHAQGVPAVLERSRSGDGGHVWVFFESRVPASAARALGAALLRTAMAARAEMDLSSYDRFFPSQDFLPKAGYGNLIALPLQGERAQAGTTVFLDPTTLTPYPDQWAFLSSVARLAPEAVSDLVATLRPAEAGPAVSLAELARRGGPPPPPVVRGQIAGRLSIERAGLPPALIAGLKHLGSVANPEFYEKQRMRFSTWKTPRFISCYSEDLEWLHLPRGLTEQVARLLDDLGSRLDLDDRRSDPAPIDVGFVGALRPQQSAAVKDLTEHDQAVLVAPPGAGKTVMACAVIAHHRTPTLVVVDRKELVDQWRSRLTEYLDVDPVRIGQIGGGRNQPTGDLALRGLLQACGQAQHRGLPATRRAQQRDELAVPDPDVEPVESTHGLAPAEWEVLDDAGERDRGPRAVGGGGGGCGRGAGACGHASSDGIAEMNRAVHATLWISGCCRVAHAAPARYGCDVRYRAAPWAANRSGTGCSASSPTTCSSTASPG